MFLLPRRSVLAIAAALDVAVHAKQRPVAAKALAARFKLPPRHLETLLQQLVRGDILRGVRGPLGGYLLPRDRRRISLAEIVAAAVPGDEDDHLRGRMGELTAKVVSPAIADASEKFFARLGEISLHDLCKRAADDGFFGKAADTDDFHI